MTDFFNQNKFFNTIEKHCLFIKGKFIPSFTKDIEIINHNIEGDFFVILTCNNQMLKTPMQSKVKNPTWKEEFCL